MVTRYPLEFKKQAVAKFLSNPENQIGAFCEDLGIPPSNLRDWMKQMERGTLGCMKAQTKSWTIAQKHNALEEYRNLSEEEQGKWLRSNGMTTERIESWKKEIQDTLLGTEKKTSESVKIKQLEKELTRKDKALAEASAILFAKKNWMLTLGRGTRKTNEDRR